MIKVDILNQVKQELITNDDFNAEDEDKKANEQERKKAEAKKPYIKRNIVHPNFKNIDYGKAVKILDNVVKDNSDAMDIEYAQGNK